MTDAFHGQRLLVRKGGLVMATPLLAVLVFIETTDVVFAVDSIPTIFADTDEVFLVFTANAFAILGLRAMSFLLADLVHRFVYLKIGLALVLMWVGVKMLLKTTCSTSPPPSSSRSSRPSSPSRSSPACAPPAARNVRPCPHRSTRRSGSPPPRRTPPSNLTEK